VVCLKIAEYIAILWIGLLFGSLIVGYFLQIDEKTVANFDFYLTLSASILIALTVTNQQKIYKRV